MESATCGSSEVGGEQVSSSSHPSPHDSEPSHSHPFKDRINGNAPTPYPGGLDPDKIMLQCFEQLGFDQNGRDRNGSAIDEEAKTTPILSLKVLLSALRGYTQFGLLAGRKDISSELDGPTSIPLFLNTDAPWSAFICGSQGSGKSYTLSCMLETCLMPNLGMGKLDHPMRAMLFHYDKHFSERPCEAASLVSNIPVRVVVSPSNYLMMKAKYHMVSTSIVVVPLLLDDKHINIERMMALMAVNAEKSSPLYIKLVKDVLQEMALEQRGVQKFSYQTFVRKLDRVEMSQQQKGFLDMRKQLLETFLRETFSLKRAAQEIVRDSQGQGGILDDRPGSLTIVDLSDPFVGANDACTLFEICLSIFLQGKSSEGRVVALDEAHKFLTGSMESEAFTARLETVIREQRHIGARVIVATQEPTIAHSFLDLCSMTIIHRFNSPAWLQALQGHIAGANKATISIEDIMKEITSLQAGEALLTCPTAMLDLEGKQPVQLGNVLVKMRTRLRLTADGGRSVMST